MKLPQLRGPKLYAHLIDLLHADAVLAGDGAAHRHAQFEYLAAEFLSAPQLARLVGIVQDQRMEIAVAGWFRPCNSSPAPSAPRRETRPCGRSTALPARARRAPCAPRSRRTARVCRGCAGCALTLLRWCRRLRTTKSPRR